MVKEEESYFTPREWAIIISLALISVLINTYLPVKSFAEYFGIPGPAAGMALFGGFIFVLWVSLARLTVKKKCSGVVTSILIAIISLFIQPWYGIMSPPWFSIYGILGLGSMGGTIEFLSNSYRRNLVAGGLGNLCCLIITWLAIGFHTHVWVPWRFMPLLILAGITSGCIGALMAQGISKALVKGKPI